MIIGVSFDDTAPKEKNTKYKVKPITKGKSLMIIFRPCLTRDDREHNFPKVIIFQSFYPPGILVKALYEEAPARDPTPTLLETCILRQKRYHLFLVNLPLKNDAF